MKFHTKILPADVTSPHTIGIFLETILKNNNLSFLGRHFLNLVGTAMGAKTALPRANLFMDHETKTILKVFLWTIFFRKRFMGNIFLIFLGPTNQLQSIRDFMSHLYPTIKFTIEHFIQEIFCSRSEDTH